ncbi:MAG: hypothetical protein EON56_00390 [Alphaproteobacteria bacterium]|nr:MAG: hypothetical protein EON56_00390 [Alphaproteobacteria bacterium]
MFGNPGGLDAEDNVDHYERERNLAQKKWPFLSERSLRRILTPKQLTEAVYATSNLTLAAADAEVHAWLKLHDARVMQSNLMHAPHRQGPDD